MIVMARIPQIKNNFFSLKLFRKKGVPASVAKANMAAIKNVGFFAKKSRFFLKIRVNFSNSSRQFFLGQKLQYLWIRGYGQRPHFFQTILSNLFFSLGRTSLHLPSMLVRNRRQSLPEPAIFAYQIKNCHRSTSLYHRFQIRSLENA